MSYAISISGHADSKDEEQKVLNAVGNALSQVRDLVGYARVTASGHGATGTNLLESNLSNQEQVNANENVTTETGADTANE